MKLETSRVRTRFAPSPTGPLHIGGVRTALYAYLFAKKHNGDFLLRIEDTDQNRYVSGAEQYIIDALQWCGIRVDEGVSVGGIHAPYRQSERKEIYKKYAQQLIDSGHAYYAFDTEEDLIALRLHYESEKSAFQYGSSTRDKLKNSLTLSNDETRKRIDNGDQHVIRLKVRANEQINFSDLIRGDVSVNSSTVDDKVLLKSDGMPTYHLAHIVDDYLMEITHAIRGEEWLPSAPAHILIYKYLGLESHITAYAHLPLLLKPDGNGKLSKRDGDRLGFPVFPLEWRDPVSGEISSGYREKGYYADGFVNMLALLGWNPGTEQEIFSMKELIELFSFEHVHKAGARFDPEKAKWFNEQYLRKQPAEELVEGLRESLVSELQLPPGDKRLSQQFLSGAIQLLKDRVQFENEFIGKGIYLFVAPEEYDQSVLAKKWKPNLADFFNDVIAELQKLDPFTKEQTESKFKELTAKHNLKVGEVMQLFRVMITGLGSGVDLFPLIELLGKEEINKRLTTALQVVNK